jgi:hypothetical protein
MTEPEPFTSIEEQQPKHRGSQLLVIAALLLVVPGASTLGLGPVSGEVSRSD